MELDAASEVFDKELLRINHVENLPSVVDLKNPSVSNETVQWRAKHYSLVLDF